jgi:hypothetical protein
MSNERSAFEMWEAWFDQNRRTWLNIGDCNTAPYVQVAAVTDCDSIGGERQAFLMQAFDPDGWFTVLDTYDPDHPEVHASPKVEWTQDCDGILDAVTQLAQWVGDLVPALSDIVCPRREPKRRADRTDASPRAAVRPSICCEGRREVMAFFRMDPNQYAPLTLRAPAVDLPPFPDDILPPVQEEGEET